MSALAFHNADNVRGAIHIPAFECAGELSVVVGGFKSQLPGREPFFDDSVDDAVFVGVLAFAGMVLIPTGGHAVGLIVPHGHLKAGVAVGVILRKNAFRCPIYVVDFKTSGAIRVGFECSSSKWGFFSEEVGSVGPAEFVFIDFAIVNG